MFSGATNIISDMWGKKKVPDVKKTKKFTISDSRRAELLEEARNRRIEWVDGKKNAVHGSKIKLSDGILNLTTMTEVLAFLEELSKPGNQQRDIKSYTESFLNDENSKQHFSLLMNNDLQDEEHFTTIDDEKGFNLAYSECLGLLCESGAVDLVSHIQTFVKSFENLDIQNKAPSSENSPGDLVHNFVDSIVIQLPKYSLFNETKYLSSEDARREVFEAFVMEKVYSKAFLLTQIVAKKDEALSKRIDSLSFVRFKHLDITATREDLLPLWENAELKLKKLNDCKSPRSKMNCILSICKDLTSLLKKNHIDERFPNADEFLPALIYLILKANPKQLHSNINYIMQYRNPSKLVSEPGYFFTHLVSAVSFIENMDRNSLSISPQEYDQEILNRSISAISSTEDQQNISLKKVGNIGLLEQGNRLNEYCKEQVEQLEEQQDVVLFPSVLDIRQERLTRLSLQQQNEQSVFDCEHGIHQDDDEIDIYYSLSSQKHLSLNDFTFMNKSESQLHFHEIPRLLREYKKLFAYCKSLKNELSVVSIKTRKTR